MKGIMMSDNREYYIICYEWMLYTSTCCVQGYITQLSGYISVL